MRRKQQILLLISTLGVITTGMISCGASGVNPESKAAAVEVPSLPVFLLEKGKMNSSIRVPGELVAFQQVDLYAKVNSFVQRLFVDVGSVVKAGQLLAKMEAPEINSQLTAATSRTRAQEALYAASKAGYERLLETSKTPGTVSPNDLDIVDAKQKSDLAQLEAARAAESEAGNTRNYLEIRAPFDGVITARNVSSGAYVGPSGKGSELPIFTLQEQGKLRLVVSVPEAYTMFTDLQQEVNFTVHSKPGVIFHAKVARLAGALDTRLRSQRTELDVINNDRSLLPGMIAEVTIPLNSKASNFILPVEAILKSTLGTFVIRVEKNTTVWIPVTEGRSNEKNAEVFGELNAGDTLVSIASEEIRNGASAGNVKPGR